MKMLYILTFAIVALTILSVFAVAETRTTDSTVSRTDNTSVIVTKTDAARTTYTCSDTDSGEYKSIYEPGAVTYNGKAYKDYCLNVDTVIEYSCNSSNQLVETTVSCWAYDTKCTESVQGGACVDLMCADSDDTKDTTTGGKVIFEGIAYKDSCEGNKLIDYYCSAFDSLKNDTYTCEKCMEGQFGAYCTDFTCIDTDSTPGSGEWGSGGKVAANGKTYKDFCDSSTELFDYYCDNSNMAHQLVQCPDQMQCFDDINGAHCAKIGDCIDYDYTEKTYMQKYTPSYVYSKGEKKYDTCVNASFITEYACSDSKTSISTYEMPCDPGYFCAYKESFEGIPDMAYCKKLDAPSAEVGEIDTPTMPSAQLTDNNTLIDMNILQDIAEKASDANAYYFYTSNFENNLDIIHINIEPSNKKMKYVLVLELNKYDYIAGKMKGSPYQNHVKKISMVFDSQADMLDYYNFILDTIKMTSSQSIIKSSSISFEAKITDCGTPDDNLIENCNLYINAKSKDYLKIKNDLMIN